MRKIYVKHAPPGSGIYNPDRIVTTEVEEQRAIADGFVPEGSDVEPPAEPAETEPHSHDKAQKHVAPHVTPTTSKH